MKKLLLAFLLTCFSVAGSLAQSYVTFWTRNTQYGKIRIYYNDTYVGTITHSRTSAPSCGASGCVTVKVVGNGNTWRAESTSGHVWTSNRVVLSSDCTRIELTGGQYVGASSDSSSNVERDSYDWTDIFDGMDGETAAAVGVVVGAAVLAGSVVIASTDLYASYSPMRGAISAGFRNSINRHIDIELLYGSMKRRNSYYGPSRYTSLNINSLYNIKARNGRFYQPTLNPYFGFSVTSDGDAGLIAGVSVGEGRWKFHTRYRYLYDFYGQQTHWHGIEFGVSFTYKYQFWFK